MQCLLDSASKEFVNVLFEFSSISIQFAINGDVKVATTGRKVYLIVNVSDATTRTTRSSCPYTENCSSGQGGLVMVRVSTSRKQTRHKEKASRVRYLESITYQ